MHVKRSAPGVRTTGPLSQDATCTVGVAMKTSFAEEKVEMEDHFVTKSDAVDSIGKLIGERAVEVLEGVTSGRGV